MTQAVITVGKTPSDENFPVARFLKRSIRPRVMAFYHCVRTADDIADNPAMTREEKTELLSALRNKLPSVIHDARDQFHIIKMMETFQNDAIGVHIETWDDLLCYCQGSAVPVGHFLLDVHGETCLDRRPADALCCAHQILNHIQDIRHDILALGRLYIPTAWLREAGLDPATIDAALHTDAFQAVLFRCLDHVSALLDIAAFLPATIQDKKLRFQARVTLNLAEIILKKLRHSIVSQTRTMLGRLDILYAGLKALFPGQGKRRILRQRLHQSGSSFRKIISLLSPGKQDRMTVFYLFCRSVDDCADGDHPLECKCAELGRWRAFLKNPADTLCPDPILAFPLAQTLLCNHLPISELHAVVEGCCMDLDPGFYPPDQAGLDLYCQCVAGAVGRVILSILGFKDSPEIRDFADRSGRALQYTNILRDIDDDAAKGRVYLPSHILAEAQATPDPAHVARQQFSRDTENHFEHAAQALKEFSRTDRIRMWPALLMLATYWALFCRLTGQKIPSRSTRIVRVLSGRFR